MNSAGCASTVLATLAFLGGSTPVLASDAATAFDRPGIAFSPSTLPKSGFAWEQGLPDFQQSSDGGATATTYAANTRLRYGISERWEIQLSIPWLEQVVSRGGRQVARSSGIGDVSVAFKVNMTPAAQLLNVAMLGAVTFPTASGDLGLDNEEYSLGTTLGWSFSDEQSVALYANVDILDGQAQWTLSPNWSFAISHMVGGYVEAGFQPATHGVRANEIAGGGVTWMVRPTMQLDAYILAGLTDASPDLLAGCGVSVFVP